jgi:RNA polymerase-binding transcription factor DksA
MELSDPLLSEMVRPAWRGYLAELLRLREALAETVGEHRTAAGEPMERFSLDEADAATDEFDHDMGHCFLSRGSEALGEVEEAIRRMVEGRYGICEISGRPIPAERLQALPWTRYIREVEEAMERKGRGMLPGLAAVRSLQGAAPGGLAQAPEQTQEEFSDLDLLGAAGSPGEEGRLATDGGQIGESGEGSSDSGS